MDQLPRLGKRELICLLLFTCNYVVSVWRGSLFLWVLGMGYVILLWHSLSLPYNYFENVESIKYPGVTIASDLKWNSHIRNVCSRANRTLGSLRQNLFSCPQDVKEAAYKTCATNP